MVTETEKFLDAMLPRLEAALRKLCAGEVEPWTAIWGAEAPVTLFGAAGSAATREEVRDVQRRLAQRFSGASDLRFELVAARASGDLAYTVGLEHKTVVLDGEAVTYTLRVTHVYRLEDGEWRIVHRHGDHPPGQAGQTFSAPR